MVYSHIYTYTKHTNLMPFAEVKAIKSGKPISSLGRKYYEANRDVKMNVYVRFSGNNVYCRVQCPINPLPVTGEFAVPKLCVLQDFLSANGWKETGRVIIPQEMRDEF